MRIALRSSPRQCGPVPFRPRVEVLEARDLPSQVAAPPAAHNPPPQHNSGSTGRQTVVAANHNSHQTNSTTNAATNAADTGSATVTEAATSAATTPAASSNDPRSDAPAGDPSMATASMRQLEVNVGGGDNGPPSAPNAPPPPLPAINGSPFNPLPQNNGDSAAATMGRGFFAALDDLDRAFAWPATGLGVASLDGSRVAVVPVPAAQPATTVTELVPVSGAAFESVVVSHNVPAAEASPTFPSDPALPEERPAIVEPKRMVPPIRHNGQRRNVAAGRADEEVPAAAVEPNQGEEGDVPASGAIVVPTLLLASWFAREWKEQEAEMREATVRR